MKNKLFVSALLFLAVSMNAKAQGYSYYNSSQYQYNNAVYQQNLYNSQINSYKPAGYGTYSTPNSSGSYGSYNYNSYTPSYNYNSYSNTPSYNSGYSSYSNASSYPESWENTYYVYSKVYLAENENESGTGEKFNIKNTDGNIYVFVYHPVSLETKVLNVKVYKFVNDKSTLMEEKTISYDSKDNKKVRFKYNFSKFGAGKYMLEISSEDFRLIGSSKIITIKADHSNDIPSVNSDYSPKKTETNSNSKVTSSSYYANSKVLFYENKEQRKNGGEGKTVLYLNLSVDTAYVVVTNDKPINTTKLHVNIEKKDNSGNYQPYRKKWYSYNDMTSKSFRFSYVFNETGDYRFDIKSEEDFWVNTGYITVYTK